MQGDAQENEMLKILCGPVDFMDVCLFWAAEKKASSNSHTVKVVCVRKTCWMIEFTLILFNPDVGCVFIESNFPYYSPFTGISICFSTCLFPVDANSGENQDNSPKSVWS